ncbi:MAG: hypothetical protein IPG04_41850 [Polyangiaceae bacterium]|nr:hypothetical protein [Polyangiaceae bacterium]
MKVVVPAGMVIRSEPVSPAVHPPTDALMLAELMAFARLHVGPTAMVAASAGLEASASAPAAAPEASAQRAAARLLSFTRASRAGGGLPGFAPRPGATEPRLAAAFLIMAPS